MVRALILGGYGINCEREMALACKLAGAETRNVHAHALLDESVSLNDFDLLMLPGGFSYGDALGAAKALANKISYTAEFKQRMQEFVHQGGCILGICNGFQLLVKLGLLPGFGDQTASLACNESGRFENRWAHHTVVKSACIFTQGIDHLYLPIRHGEGQLVFSHPSVQEKAFQDKLIVLRYANSNGNPTNTYPDNPNGSVEAIAGMCDPTGRILGMMAHPEAALRMVNHPQWTRLAQDAKRQRSPLPWQGEGLKIFQNAVNYAKDHR